MLSWASAFATAIESLHEQPLTMLCITQLSEAMHSRIPVAPLVGLSKAIGFC